MYSGFEEQEVAADYLQLLRRGSVIRRLVLTEHRAWRRAIRSRAYADELRIRTWSRDGAPATVVAVLRDWTLTPEERLILQPRRLWLRED